MKTVEIQIWGRVQKVGMRNCIRRIAAKLNIKGEVMNLSDGTVRVYANGDQIVLDKFVSMIYGCPRAVIKDLKISDYDPLCFDDFSVRR